MFVAPLMIVRGARADEAGLIAAPHAEIATGFLPTLGRPFLARLYKALIVWPPADVLVADRDGDVRGFVASVEHTGAFYKHFVLRHGLMAGIAALPRLVRPSVIRRVFETFRYGTDDAGAVAHAELFAVATAAETRGEGVGSALLDAATARYRERGLTEVQVVVGADNEASLAAHRKAGFVDRAMIEVHKGEPSKVLVWSASL